jgi:hypothetical protein
VEWCERGSPRGSAQDAMTRFTSFPCPFLISYCSRNVALPMPVSTETAARGYLGGVKATCDARPPFK